MKSVSPPPPPTLVAIPSLGPPQQRPQRPHRRGNNERLAPLPGHEPSAPAPAGMRRHSSASSDGDDASPVEPAPPSSSSRLAAAALARDSPNKLDRRRSADRPPSFSISRRSSSINWRPPDSRSGNGAIEKPPPSPSHTSPSSPLGLIMTAANGKAAHTTKDMEKPPETTSPARRPQWRSPWAISLLALLASVTGIGFLLAVVHSSATRQLDPKGCRMSYMRPSYAKLDEFDTEHTRLASKYSLYLYREQGIDHDTKVRWGFCCQMKQWVRGLANLERAQFRSGESPFCSSPAMPGATSRFAPSRPKPPTTSTTSCSTTRLPSRPAPAASTFSPSTSTRTLPPSTARPCSTRPST